MKPKTDWGVIQRESAARQRREELASTEKLIASYTTKLTQVEKERDIALRLTTTPLGKIPSIVARDTDGDSEATAFAIASDWHSEETCDPKTINGLNEFNLEIAEQRIERFFQSVLNLTRIERNGTKIPHLVLALLGDMMTGYIHEELQESNGLSPTETILWLRKRIVAGLRLLLDEGEFETIKVPCCYGNHGRTTKKTRHATGAKNSYEWMLYNILKEEVPEVEWSISDGYFTFLEVYGRMIRFHHGDNVQYNGGIGGLTIPMEKAISAWNKGRDRAPYLDIFGHWHTAMQNPRFISNGSLIGYGAYSLAIKAGFEPPQQTFFLLDSVRGRTGTWPIYLT